MTLRSTRLLSHTVRSQLKFTASLSRLASAITASPAAAAGCAVAFKSLGITLPLALTLFAAAMSTTDSSADHTSSFIKHSIKPDLLQEAPAYVCTVQYDSHVVVTEGNELTVKQTQSKPQHISWPHDDKDEHATYAVLMVDPGEHNTEWL